MKQAILSSTGGAPTVTVSDKDVEYLKRLQAQQDRAKFNQFIANIFEYSDPANRDKFLRLFPEYAEIRKKLVANRAELEQKIASLQITGVQSKEDIMTWYGLMMGHIDMPDKPLFDPRGYYNSANEYKAGPFAPRYENKKAQILHDLNRSLGFSDLEAFWKNTGDSLPLPAMGLGAGNKNFTSPDEKALVEYAGFAKPNSL